jgi:hypothetical protein
MSLLVTALPVAALVAILALIVAGPIRAVREDRHNAAEERRWVATGRFPAQVERVYRRPGLLLTDAQRLGELGYELGERRRVRGAWGRLQEVTWRAAGPPAKPDDTTRDAPAAEIARGADTAPEPG